MAKKLQPTYDSGLNAGFLLLENTGDDSFAAFIPAPEKLLVTKFPISIASEVGGRAPL